MHPIDLIVQCAARVAGVTPSSLYVSSARGSEFVRARRIAIVIMRRDLDLSHSEIGRRLRLDHTTVLHAMRVVRSKLDRDVLFLADVAKARQMYARGLAKARQEAA